MIKRILVCDGCGKEKSANVGSYMITVEKRIRTAAVRVGPRPVGGGRARRRRHAYFMAEMDLCAKCAARPISLLKIADAVQKKELAFDKAVGRR